MSLTSSWLVFWNISQIILKTQDAKTEQREVAFWIFLCRKSINFSHYLPVSGESCEHIQQGFLPDSDDWESFDPSHHFISPLFLPNSNVNPKHYVNNTDTFIHRQNALHFTLAGLFSFSPPQPFIPLSLPPLFSSLSPLPWSFPDRPTANVHQMPHHPHHHPPPPPPPPACHCSPLCSIQTDGIAISTGFSLPVSASVSHTPHCLFCLPFSYPLPSEK